MDRTTELHYLISGNNQFGRINLSRAAAGAGRQEGKRAFAGRLFGREDIHAPGPDPVV
jgi:hypothetical protein